MAGAPSSEDFSRRLAAAMQRARGGGPAGGAPSSPPAPPPATAAAPSSDAFNRRLATALAQSRGAAGQPAWHMSAAEWERQAAEPPAAVAEGSQEQTQEAAQEPQAAGGQWVTVDDGESTESIAYKFGHFWETVWEHSNNSALREKRRDPHTLNPGDELFVPDLRRKEEPGATEQRHRFRRRGNPTLVRVQVKEGGKPRANEPYRFEVNREVLEGMTDAEGVVEVPIHPLARAGRLTIGEGERRKTYYIRLRHLHPASEPSGVNARLHNLGYLHTYEGNRLSPATRAALRQFQADHGLEATGELTPETSAMLIQVHGC